MRRDLAFSLAPFAGKWFPWDRVAACFWPGAGRRSAAVDAVLAPVRDRAGVYLMAWGDPEPVPRAGDPAVRYMGQSQTFKTRMRQFGTSAGFFWSERYDGHSAAWRWPLGRTERLSVAFCPLETGLSPHLATGYLYLEEALALDAYYADHGTLPPLNLGGSEIELD